MTSRIVQYKNPEVPILGYTYIDDPSLTVKQRKRFEQVTTVFKPVLSNLVAIRHMWQKAI